MYHYRVMHPEQETSMDFLDITNRQFDEVANQAWSNYDLTTDKTAAIFTDPQKYRPQSKLRDFLQNVSISGALVGGFVVYQIGTVLLTYLNK